MRYRVTAAGRAFDVEVRAVAGGWRASVTAFSGAADEAPGDPAARSHDALSIEAAAVAPGGWVSWRAGDRIERLRVDAPAGTGDVQVSPERAPGGAPHAVRVEDARRARLPAHGRPAALRAPVTVTAPMPGRVVKLLVQAGQAVRAGQPVTVVEAMKMENELLAPREGRVERVLVSAGDGVEAGAALVVIA